MNKETLHEALERLGLSSKPSELDGRRSINKGVHHLGDYTAEEAWALVHDLEENSPLNADITVFLEWRNERV